MSAVMDALSRDTALAAAQRPPPQPTTPNQAVLQAVREVADGALAELADDIDRRGIYPKSILLRLGELGAFKLHMALDGQAPDYGAAIQAIAEVSRVCGATGFMMWCHNVCGVYMEQSGNAALMGRALANHAMAHTLGATGMSNPM